MIPIQYRCSFRSLVSKGFPRGYSKSVCVRVHSESSEPKMLSSQTTPDTPRRRRLADSQLSSLYPPSPVSARLAPRLWCCVVPFLLSLGSPFAFSSFFVFLSFSLFRFQVKKKKNSLLLTRYGFWFGLFSFAILSFSVFMLLVCVCCAWSTRYDGMTLRCVMWLPYEYCMTMYY